MIDRVNFRRLNPNYDLPLAKADDADHVSILPPPPPMYGDDDSAQFNMPPPSHGRGESLAAVPLRPSLTDVYH